MSLWKIAWRSIQQRAFSSALTAFSMALGVALVVAVLVIYGVIDQSFRRSAQGYDLIVGAKGSPLELVLSTVYHLRRPTDTIPHTVCDVLNTSTKYGPFVEVAVPTCLGDSFKGFRVIGTTSDMFYRLQWFDGDKLRSYEWQDGGNFADDQPFEAVVGAAAARRGGLEVGKTFRPVHGTVAEHGKEHEQFRVVGVLKPTGTAADRAIYVNIEGFYGIHAESEEGGSHSPATEAPAKKPPEGPAKTAPDAADHGHDSIPQVTAILVSLKENVDAGVRKALPKIIGQDLSLNVQAVNPTQEVTQLLEGIVGNLQLILLILAVLIVIVAGIGVMVSIYNSMSDRRHEIAVIRALGAKRRTVMVIVLLESILLALGGGAVGLALGHGLTGALAPMIAEWTGVVVNPLQFQLNELILVPGLILLASAVGYMPAVVAYRTDVAQSLISSP
jgi:putative ABC transport system permease protein